MLNKKRISLVLALIIVFLTPIIANAASTQTFDIEIVPIKSSIDEDDIAQYNLTISNDADIEDTFLTPYTSDADWVLTTDPQVFKVPAKSSLSYTIFVDPKTEVIPGQYGSTLNVKSSVSGQIRKSMFLIYIRPLNPLPMGYTSSIALNVEVPTDIDPTKQIPLKVYIRNRNAKEYQNLTIEIKSELINKIYSTYFKALEEKTEEFSFNIDAYTKPKDDKLTVTLYNGNETINQIKVPIRVIAYSDVKEKTSVDQRFLKTKTTVTLTNFGNIENNNPYKYEIGFFQKIVTTTLPAGYNYVTNDKNNREMDFPLNLGPGDSMSIEITTNYRFLVYTLIIIIVAIVIYYQLRSPVIVKKEAMTHEATSQGVSEFKVKVLIKNRSQKPVENIKIIEVIPSLALLVKEAAVGTMEPTKVIQNENKGTLIRWDINYLEPFEERIITYRLKSKLNIVGGLTLQPTKAKFETSTGRERVTFSKKHKIEINEK